MHRFLAILLATGLCTAAVVSAQTLNSHLLVDVGKQFILGGNQRGAIRMMARNSGLVTVSIGERRRNGSVLERGRLEPGKSARLEFDAGSAALIRNTGKQQAVLDLTVKGAGDDSRMAVEPLANGVAPAPAE